MGNGYEKLDCYKASIRLNELVLPLCYELRTRYDRVYITQMKRASLSITSNLVEGYGRISKKQQAQFLRYSIGSCNELTEQLKIFRHDPEFVDLQSIADIILSELEGVTKLLWGYYNYLLK